MIYNHALGKPEASAWCLALSFLRLNATLSYTTEKAGSST